MTPEEEAQARAAVRAADVRRGAEAQQLLANPLLKEAFDIIEQRLEGEIYKIETPADRAEYLRKVLIGGKKFRLYLAQVVQTGKFAEEEEQRSAQAEAELMKAMHRYRQGIYR